MPSSLHESDLDIAAAAAELGVSKNFVRNAIHRGDLRAYRIRGTRMIRIPRAALEEFKAPVTGEVPR